MINGHRPPTTAAPPTSEQLAATVEEVGRLRWLLRRVAHLATAEPTLTDRELRDRLLTLAESGAR